MAIFKTYLTLKATTPEYTHLRVDVDYDKGGMFYFSGKSSARGIYAYVQAIKREDRGTGFVSESFTLFSSPGYKALLVELPRYSAKRAQEQVEAVKAQLAAKSGQVWDTIQAVLAKGNLQLA